MADSNITFANIVSTPTASAWSQAYTAGKLYAVVSLEKQNSEVVILAAIGKDIINALVEEYFTLETKDLTTIKKAVLQTTSTIPKDTHCCLVVVSIVGNILYAYSFGGGKVLLKRDGTTGTVLQTPADPTPMVHAVSGFLQEADMIMLETNQFAEIITSDDISSFATPAEALEMLSPKIHEKEAGGASAIVLSYIPQTIPAEEPGEKPFQEKEEEESPSALQDEVIHREIPHKPSFTLPKLHIPLPKNFIKLPRKTLLFLLAPIILIGVLIVSIQTAKQKQEDTKMQQLFDKVYPKAQKKYEEGVALISLNKPLALDDFSQSKKIITDALPKFPKDSNQYQKLNELLAKVSQVAPSETGGTMMTASETDASQSPLLSALLKNKQAVYATMVDHNVYLATPKGVADATGKITIPNDGDFTKLGGFGTFGTNLYILDSGKNQIIKYLGGQKESKSTYAQDEAFGKAVGMSIDSSIYVLQSSGQIMKYTRGIKDTFGVSGLTTPLHNPKRIYTNPDIDNLYILDSGNSRIVVLNKTGAFQNAYSAKIIKDAKDFDVNEEKKMLYVLTDNKVYKIKIP